MGPAVTSEAVSCEREKRLRNTASLSPHNFHSNPLPLTRMSVDESVNSVESHINPCSSSQPTESSAGVPSPTSNGQTACPRLNLTKVVDGGVFSVSVKPRNVNFVNIKDIQGCRKMSIFLKNNPRVMLPSCRISCTSSRETNAVEASACDEPVPCRTVLRQPKLTELVNSCRTEDGVLSGDKTHHTIIMPKSQTTEDAENPQRLEFDSSGIAENNRALENVSPVASEETESLQSLSSLDEALSRQKIFNSRASRLLKRLRRLQCREVNSAVKEQLGQLAVALGQAVGEKTSETTTQKPLMKDTLGNRELTALSTAELVSYIQKMQSSQQRDCSHRQPVGLGSLPTDNDNDVILSDAMQSGVCKTSKQLLSNMRHLKSALDSDATESSSGGESDDEKRPPFSESSPNNTVSALARTQLENEWAKDRSGIISRWTWLQAQVSDLEYRIRQQGDIYKQLRLSKGSVSLRDPSCTAGDPSANGDLNGRIKASKLNISDSENQKNMSASDTCLVRSESVDSRDGFCLKPSSNGRQSNAAELLSKSRITISDGDILREKLVPLPTSCPSSVSLTALQTTHSTAATRPLSTVTPPLGNCSSSAASSQAPSSWCDPSCRAARCMELRGLRRRMVLRTAGLHEVSRKASQLSMVRCTCYPPVTPCALCGGRYDRVLRPGPMVSTRDRLTLLDPSYHSVMSFPQDVPLLLRMAESHWLGPSRDDNFAKHSFRPSSVRVKNNRTNSRSMSDELQQEQEISLKESAGDQCHYDHRIQSDDFHGRKSSLHMMETMRKKKHLSISRKHLSKASIRSSSLKSNRMQLLRRGYLTDAALKRQTSRSTFDIDNVLIPSHVTSAARVDIIQYKEIITPKWRKISRDCDLATTGGNTVDARRMAFHSVKRPRLSKSESDGTKKVHWNSEELDSTKHFSESSDLFGNDTDAEEEMENLSDEAFAARHLRYEIYEKKQCMPVNVGHQRRSRSNRSESDSFTLLNPQSPDAGHLDASASFTSSTLSGGPSTSCLGYSDAEDSSHHHDLADEIPARQQSETKLARNLSASPWNASLSAVYHSEQSSEQAEGGSAWPPRTFPLGDFENEQLFAESPEKSIDHEGTGKILKLVSPATSTSTESAEPVEEDPDDPDWTVMARSKDRPDVLVKFAKV